MNKVAIICKLHEIADYYLLGPSNWPVDKECLPTFFRTVRNLGLDEDVPDSRPGTTRPTSLGRELQLDMLMAFVGAWDIWEIPLHSRIKRIHRRIGGRGDLVASANAA